MLVVKNITISIKYLDFIDIFSKKLTTELFKKLEINKYMINLESDKQLFYELIYSLKSIELEIFKTYIKNNLANDFIQPSKSSTKAPILFI